MEKRAVNDMFVILSDVWLDNEEVLCNVDLFLFFSSFPLASCY